MKGTWTFKVIVSVFLVIIAIYYLIPTFWGLEHEEGFVAKLFPKKIIRLGLDLQGGIHLVLGVDIEKVIKNEVDKYAQTFKDYLSDKKIDIEEVTANPEEKKIIVKLKNGDDKSKARDLIRDNFNIFVEDEKAGLLYSDFPTIVLKPNSEWESKVRNDTVKQAVDTIRNRIDEFGVAEPTIAMQGTHRILVELPGVKDPERALEVIRKTALLEFKLVDTSKGQKELEEMIKEAQSQNLLSATYTDKEVNEVLKDKLPSESELLFEIKKDETTLEETKRPWLIQKKTLLTGEVLEDVRVRQDTSQFGSPSVSLKMNASGAELFEKITEDHTGDYLAIILDNRVNSAPVIKEKIAKQSAMAGQVSIELGSMKNYEALWEEANDLALVLRAGSLPAPVTVEENRSVGPSLGKDSIEAGKYAIIVSCLVVFIFMIIYYGACGFLADMAVFLNLLFTLAVLSLFQATLTLPGLAGMALTVGMAVDANVIIYERIREELRAGKTARSSINLGFSKAHLTILDANLTTIIAAVVLFQYGTGPIKGFALTLMIGLISNYITAYWMTRMVFEHYYDFKRLSTVSIGIKNPVSISPTS